MRFEQLAQMMEIEKCRSITKAAGNLFISQPALSAALNTVEQEIGVKIFERTRGGVQPTPEGEDILGLFKQILNGYSEVLNYQKRAQNLYGEVTVVITPAYGFLFSDILIAFKNRFPNAELNLQVAAPEEIIHKLTNGIVDIGVTIWELLPEQIHALLQEQHIQFETFGRHEMMLYVSRNKFELYRLPKA